MPRRLRPIQAYSESTSRRYIHQASGFFHRTSLMEAATDLMTGEAPCEGARKDPDAQPARAWVMAHHARHPHNARRGDRFRPPDCERRAHLGANDSANRRPSKTGDYAIRINRGAQT
jgi:hypothetical protein